MGNLFDEVKHLYCDACGTELKENGIIVIVKNDEMSAIQDIKDVYLSCKGQCDEKLQTIKSPPGRINTWEELDHIKIPIMYLRWTIGIMNGMKAGDKYTEQAFETLKNVIIVLAQDVYRDMSEEEIKIADGLMELPPM